MYNSKDRATVLNLSVNEELFRLLTLFAQTGSIDNILDNISNLRRFLNLVEVNEIPGLKELLDEHAHFMAHIEKNPMQLSYLIRVVSGSPSEETKRIVEKLKVKYRVVSKWSIELCKTVHSLREEGVLAKPQASPNRSGKHYQAAQIITQKLSEYWFIKRVRLFGSVCKGTERTDSDIDLAIEIFDYRADVGHILSFIQREYSDKLKIRISFLIIQPKKSKANKAVFDNLGFFESSEVLFEQNQWHFSIRNKIIDFNEADYQAFYAANGPEGETYHCLRFKKESELPVCLAIVNNVPIALCSGFRNSKRDGWNFRVPKVVVGGRRLSTRDEHFITELMWKLNFS